MSEPKEFSVVSWPIEKLVPYERNAKIHDEAQVKELARSIAKHGWTQPLVIEKDGTIIAGHGRRLAAIALGLKKVPVVVRDDLTKVEAAALRLSDNRLPSTQYDTTIMSLEIQDIALELDGIDLGDLLIGFSEHELDFTTADLGEIDQDVFVEDVGDAVEKQKTENGKKVEEVDAAALPVGEALGFKRVTPEQSRRIRAFIARVEGDTEKKGVEALMAFLDALEVV